MHRKALHTNFYDTVPQMYIDKFFTFIACNDVAENYRLDITYENNLIIKLVLVSDCIYHCLVHI